MAAMKSMIEYVIDCGCNMKETLTSEIPHSKLSLALGIVSTHMSQRIAASKTIELGVMGFGCDETNNFLDGKEGEYPSISEFLEMSRQNVHSMRKLADIESGVGAGDMISAITVAQDILMRINANYKFNRLMILITDGQNKIGSPEDFEFLSSLVQKMKEKGLIFHAILVGKALQEHEFIRHENKKVLESIANETGGRVMEVIDVGEAISMLSSGTGMSTTPRLSKITLEISPECKIQCGYWGKIGTVPLPSIKKRFVPLPSSTSSSSSTVPTEIEIDRLVQNPADPDEILSFEDRIKGYKYGKQYIPINEADEQAMKLPSSKPIIKILGFIPSKRIPRHHFIDKTYILEGQTEDYSNIIYALNQAMNKLQQVAIVRFVKGIKEDGDPWLAVLLPYLDDPYSLILHRLPCSDDIRDFQFPSLRDPRLGDQPTSQQKKTLSSLIDSMTKQPSKNDKTPFKITTFNPCHLAVFGELQQRAIYKDCDSSKTKVMTTSGNPFQYLGETPDIKPLVSAVIEVFPLSQLEVTAQDLPGGKKKKRSYWSDIYLQQPVAKQQRGEGDEEGGEAVTDGELDQDLEQEAGSNLPTLSLGSVSPVEDFQAVRTAVIAAGGVGTTGEEVGVAMDTLGKIIELLVTNGGTGAHYRKAVACLKAMREAAVGEGEHERFNKFMMDIVKGVLAKDRHRPFWNEVVEAAITLVSTDEDSGSSVSPAESKRFLADEAEATPLASTQLVTEDEDDMFGNMQ